MTGRSGWRLRLLLQMSARKGVSPSRSIYLTRPPEERWGSKAGNWLQETRITRFWRSWWSSPWLPAVWWDVRGSPWQCGRVPPTNHRPNTKFGSGTRLQWSPRWRHGCQLRTGVVQAGLLAALLSYNGAPSLPRQSGYCHSGTRRTMVATQGSVDGCPRGRHLVGLSWRHSSGPLLTWLGHVSGFWQTHVLPALPLGRKGLFRRRPVGVVANLRLLHRILWLPLIYLSDLLICIFLYDYTDLFLPFADIL